MKKVLRFLLVLILILVVGYLVICLVAPSETKVEKSIVINAPKEVVWDQMVHFGKWENWSPWTEMDTAMVVTLGGEDGTKGSTYHWVGEKSGEGHITNTGVEGGKMTYHMDFIKPFKSQSEGFVMVEDAENGQTKATWSYTGQNSFMWRGMMMMMKGSMAKSFDQGLEKLKTYAEANPKMSGSALPAYQVTETNFPGGNYAGIRKTIGFQDFSSFMEKSFETLGKSAGDRINGNPAAIVYKWDEKNSQTDVMAVFSVSEGGPIKDATMTKLPAEKAYMVVYTGPYNEGEMGAHEAMGKYLAEHKLEQKLVVEDYIKNPGNEKDPNKYVTNIYYFVK
jgi:effector-binding domain-containing protein